MDRYEAVYEIDSRADARAVQRLLDQIFDTLREEIREVGREKEDESPRKDVLDQLESIRDAARNGGRGTLTVVYETDASSTEH